ncbi:Protein CBG20590 [Caenorhabditis briggsae]|uniref:Protein CBG20590 n=1 Tax=Caenorhabditis briggsae TaxID=6238 RepID=A8XY57_CAEBR|nr:Protein CBG20590 [Caenorhabditis briggsae]CAP37574.2 Protein CBG20590 [Caenorhabditis briggsae]
MRRSIAVLSVLLVSQTSAFLFGGGCCQAPVMQSPCCGGATSWAYAPPQVIGYERIPLYAKVPMPAPPTYLVRSRPVVQRVVQSEPYYPPPPPPPPLAPPVYQPQPSYPAPMDNFASGPQSAITSVSNRIPSVIPPPQDRYDDGDVIVIETDDNRRRRMSKFVQPPPQGYVSQPVAPPQGYQQGPPPQQPQGYMGQVEQGIEVTPDQINSGYQPHQGEAQAQFSSSQGQFAQSQGQFAQGPQGQFDGAASDIASQSTGLVQSVANNAAFESAGIAPSARRLRKFKN